MSTSFVSRVMRDLATSYDPFRNEAEFCSAFRATVLNHGGTELRVEVPRKFDRHRARIDLEFRLPNGEPAAIEFKYRPRSARLELPTKLIELRSHGANDLGRYDFLKDVRRIETLVEEGAVARGWAILLTNDWTYWTPGSAGTRDREFRLEVDRIVEGTLRWQGEKSSKDGRHHPLVLKARYLCEWCDYHRATDAPGGEFKYLCLEIGSLGSVAARGRSHKEGPSQA